MNWQTSVLVLLTIASGQICLAQMTPDEALKHIGERQAAAATQPDDPKAEIAMLKSVIAEQAKQIESLKAEVAALRAREQAVAAPPDAAAAAAPDAGTAKTYEWKNVTIKDGQIMGECTNNSGQDYKVACFSASLYDDNDNLLEVVPLNISNFNAGDTKSVTMFVKSSGVKKYKIQFDNGI
ncbi:MAG: FxLYD domain-containing protein [Tepidisphaeraceae bacterium]